jgi:pimeloyl-ACP methyl ester carboxylesterase
MKAISSHERRLEDAGKIFGGAVVRIFASDPGELSADDLEIKEQIIALTGRELDPAIVNEQHRTIINGARTGLFNILGAAGIDKPTLLVAGNEDPLTRPINTRFMSAVMPQAELHVEYGVGHDVLVSRAGSVAARANRFFDADFEPTNFATAALSLWLRCASNLADATVRMLPGL